MNLYEEKYNEILEWARKNKARLNGVPIEEVLPELRESEEESTRKALIETVKCIYAGDTMFLSEQQRDRYLAWLEKQKYNRMQPVYDNQESFESALEKAWKSYNESGARTVDSCEDDYIECAHAKGFREGYLFGLEKQEDLTTENIYKHSRERMSFWNGQQKEQKPADLSEMMVHKEPYIAPVPTPMVADEQKPAEWSEEDERNIRNLESVLYYDKYLSDETRTELGNFLKSLPERFNLQPKQEWSEEDEACIRNLESIIYYDKKLPNDTRVILGEFLSNLRPQPQGTYKQVIHTIFGMLKDKDFYEIQPSHRVSLLNDIRVKCKDAIECAPILDEPSWKPSEVCYGPKGDPDPAGVWKPSEEQMKVLQWWSELPSCPPGLKSLYEDLKKLI